jgi:N-acetylmuramoyl-L-alanine amidase
MMYHPQQASFFFSKMQSMEDQLAAVILNNNPKTIAEIKSRYNSSGVFDVKAKKVRILLVPGHEPDYGGAEYGLLREREMTVELVKDLQQLLQKNSKYEIFVTRDDKAWDPTFANYWKTGWDDIIAWQKGHKDIVTNMTRIGKISSLTPSVVHRSAPPNVALRLHGIGKWANENDIDIVLHIHFNDSAGHPAGVPGRYSGFSIYVPQKDYYNSTTTKALADSVFKRLQRLNAVSDLPGESEGIIEDQDLIAIGANNSVDAASMLIEYGYIYEPQFTNNELRDKALQDLAFQTYLGLQDFFEPRSPFATAASFDTLAVPYKWSNSVASSNANFSDVYALQTALVLDGVYPPAGKTLNDCPRTGTIGGCTRAALQAFQNKYGIKGEDGTIGSKTIEMLNNIYGSKTI